MPGLKCAGWQERAGERPLILLSSDLENNSKVFAIEASKEFLPLGQWPRVTD